jgi:hypothetical protein
MGLSTILWAEMAALRKCLRGDNPGRKSGFVWTDP